MEAFETQFQAVLDGMLPEAETASFLLDLAERGETAAEIFTAARLIRARAITFAGPENAIDVCGTGGDQAGTVNISTAVAILLAACGVPVAKHGNRAATSQAGATDVVAALGIATDLSPIEAEQQLREIGITFLSAPLYHPVLKRVAPLRKSLGQRTIFNLLGPLLNPAGVKRHLLGVFGAHWTRLLAEALRELGSTRAWVVHGDGLDELAISGPSQIAELRDGQLTEWTLEPADYGLQRWRKSDLQGGTARQNAAAMRALFAGAPGAYRDIVLLNSAAGLVIADKVPSLEDGLAMASDALDRGLAAALLQRLSNEPS
jgi:anthranilate phosphoribosyltransferase